PYYYSGYYGGTYTSYFGEVGVLVGTGQGGFGLPDAWTDTGTLPYDLTIGNLNGDDNPDLALAGAYWYYGNYVGVLFGDGSGGLSPASSYSVGSYPGAVATGDFTGDGKLDLVAVGYSVDVLPGTGTNSFGSVVSSASGPNFMADVAAADFNNDKKL